MIQNINQEPQRLRFDPIISDALVSQMQPKKPIKLIGIGNTESDQRVIQDYAHFFLEKGYQVQLFTIGMAIPAPSQKITLQQSSDLYQLTVAPSAF